MITTILRSYFSTKLKRFTFKFIGIKEFKKWQKNKLKKYLKKELPKVRFYPKGNKKFKDLPIMDKKKFMENFQKLNTKNISFKDAYTLAKESEEKRDFFPKINKISVGLSSGTSGNTGIFLTSDKEQAEWAGSILAKANINIFKKQNIALFFRANNNLYEKIKTKRINFKYFDIYNPMKENYDKLVVFNPEVIVGPPSVLMDIIKKDKNKKLNPKKIISVAEVLSEEDKIYIEKHFNKKVGQIYQAMEGFLGSSCKENNIHLNEDLIYFEKEWIDKKRFIPIITDFSRKTQKVVRYRLNDILHIGKKCNCGLPFTTISQIEGRMDDVLEFNNSKKENVKIYPDFIRRAMIQECYIEDYLVEKVSLNGICVHLSHNEKDETVKIVKNSIGQLKKKFDLSFKVSIRKDLNRNKGEKRRRVVNFIKNN